MKQTNQQTYRRLYCIVMPIPFQILDTSYNIMLKFHSYHSYNAEDYATTHQHHHLCHNSYFSGDPGWAGCSFSSSVPEQNLWEQMARYFHRLDVTKFNSVKTLNATRNTDPQ